MERHPTERSVNFQYIFAPRYLCNECSRMMLTFHKHPILHIIPMYLNIQTLTGQARTEEHLLATPVCMFLWSLRPVNSIKPISDTVGGKNLDPYLLIERRSTEGLFTLHLMNKVTMRLYGSVQLALSARTHRFVGLLFATSMRLRS